MLSLFVPVLSGTLKKLEMKDTSRIMTSLQFINQDFPGALIYALKTAVATS